VALFRVELVLGDYSLRWQLSQVTGVRRVVVHVAVIQVVVVRTPDIAYTLLPAHLCRHRSCGLPHPILASVESLVHFRIAKKLSICNLLLFLQW